MPKKMNSKSNPRKFSDKIALIKQKEALSNASFHSAILGLTEITKTHHQPEKDVYNSEIKDNYSSNSYSPESFTSESTAKSFKTSYASNNEFVEIKMENMVVDHSNDVFKSCHELSHTDDVRQLRYYDEVKFRHGSDRTYLQTPDARHSNIEGYNPHNKNLTHLFEPVSSGSLPDVSKWSTPKEFTSRLSDDNNRYRNTINKDHVNLQETLSTLQQVKQGKNGKMAILEHLKNRGVQTSNIHPHHFQSPNDSTMMGITNMISNPLHKSGGHTHDHSDFVCASNISEGGYMKHYSAANSPYLSLPHRERQNLRDVEVEYRQRNMSGNPNHPMKYMQLNIDCYDGNDEVGSKIKALTPTGYQSNQLFDNESSDMNVGLLHPSMFSNVITNENWRRVASESSIQNSVQYQNDRLSQFKDVTIPNENISGRVHSLKESVSYPYQRNLPMTPFSIPNSSNTADLQREISQISVTSSFLDNLLSLRSPDENLDPSLISDVNIFKTPDVVEGRVFTFNELKGFQDSKPVELSPLVTVNEKLPTVNNEAYRTYHTGGEEINAMSCDNDTTDQQEFQNLEKDKSSHECYWGHQNEVLPYTNKPSPNIKACDNLDPKYVPVDLFTDFSNIPEITLNEGDAQRRDSLNWTDEVLKNLNNDNESNQSRDRAMSGCTPLIALTEEYIVNTFAEVNEY